MSYKDRLFVFVLVLVGFMYIVTLVMAGQYFKLVYNDYHSRLYSTNGQQMRNFSTECRSFGNHYTSVTKDGNYWVITCKEYPDEITQS